MPTTTMRTALDRAADLGLRSVYEAWHYTAELPVELRLEDAELRAFAAAQGLDVEIRTWSGGQTARVTLTGLVLVADVRVL